MTGLNVLTKTTKALLFFLIVAGSGCDELASNETLNVTVPASIQFDEESQVSNTDEMYEIVTLFNQGNNDIIIREIFISSSYESGFGYYLEEIDEIDLIIYSHDSFSFHVYTERIYDDYPSSSTIEGEDQVKIEVILFNPNDPEEDNQLSIRIVNDLIDYKSDPFMIYQGNLDIEKLDILEIERINSSEARR